MSEDTNQYIEQRRKKAEELREMGVNPYANGVEASATAAWVHAKYDDQDAEALEKVGEKYSVAGRIMASSQAMVSRPSSTGRLR